MKSHAPHPAMPSTRPVAAHCAALVGRWAMLSRLLVGVGVGVGLPRLAYAVPNFDIGPGAVLLILLLLVLVTVGIPAVIGLLVRWLLVWSGKVLRSGFVLPIFLACLGWLLGWLLQVGLGGLLAGLPLGWLLYWVVPLVTTAGAATLGTYIGEA